MGTQSRSRPDRRYSLHFEADRWSFPGVWARDPCQPAAADREADREHPARRRCSAPPSCSNEKYRGIRLAAQTGSADASRRTTRSRRRPRTRSRFPYTGEESEIGFNVNYLLDALSAIEGEQGRDRASRTPTAAAW
mgnify:CR=1 FL=1